MHEKFAPNQHCTRLKLVPTSTQNLSPTGQVFQRLLSLAVLCFVSVLFIYVAKLDSPKPCSQSVVARNQLQVDAVANTPGSGEGVRRGKSDLGGPLSKAFSNSTSTDELGWQHCLWPLTAPGYIFPRYFPADTNQHVRVRQHVERQRGPEPGRHRGVPDAAEAQQGAPPELHRRQKVYYGPGLWLVGLSCMYLPVWVALVVDILETFFWGGGGWR